ncbi:unnamed protein product [Knipowitschia caucasica]|uniref:SH2 domain-containing protein n=1 Tax=Knipowitschia caucasica TaxID=637954 RepID=A0AAV2JLV2_KNICA
MTHQTLPTLASNRLENHVRGFGPKCKTHTFNMDSLSKMTAPAAAKFRQLQKIVQDIKKNDGSLLDKLRRLRKTVPRLQGRDHRGEDREDSDSSDPDYDNEMYADPREDHDDSYEPPPSHHHHILSSGPVSRGEYLGSCPSRPERPLKKPQRPVRTPKRHPPPPLPLPEDNDEADYISPDGSNDEDYIEPNENPPHRGRAAPPQRPDSPEVYEVPDNKPQPPPTINRLGPKTSQTHPLPPSPSPRLPPRSPPPEQTDEEYEVCDGDNRSSVKPRDSRPLPLPLPRPRPLPRERSPNPPLKPKVPAKPLSRAFEARTLPVTTSEPELPAPKSSSLDLKRPKIPLPLFMSQKHTEKETEAENGNTEEDEESELHCKPWFAGSCDRKTADQVLAQTNQDGAFLVRNSSGHDAQQPFTLVVFHNDHVYNIPVRLLSTRRQYALGREKTGEEYFRSVTHIIEHHQQTPLVLIDGQSNSKDATRLCFPVRP